MDILQSIDTDVSSMVSSSFGDFISQKVKEEIEKGKGKFLNDLNMCEEEYPIFEPSNELTEEDIELLKSSLELGYKMVNKEHPDFRYVISNAKRNIKEGEIFDEKSFKEEYEKMYGKILSYYKTLTEYPQRIIDVGIAEEHAITYAAGMSAAGILPIIPILIGAFGVYVSILNERS